MPDRNENQDLVVQQIKPRIPIQIPQSRDKEVLQQRSDIKLSLEFAKAPNTELKNTFIPFDGEWMPDSDPIEIGAKNYKTLQNMRYGGHKVLHLESVLGYSKINTTSLTTYSYENIRNGHQLQSQHTKKTYVLVHTEHDTVASNYSKIYQNQTTIPSQGNFESTALHTDSAYSLEGRFSDAPGGQVAYCNGEESCIWAGEEMKCAGFVTFTLPRIIGATDISFVDGGASADTITDGGSGFVTAGFKAGHTILVESGTTNNNNKSFRVVTVAAGTLTLETGVVTAEANQSAILRVDFKDAHEDAIDYTEAINNTINSAAESATLAATATDYWVVLSTRPLQGVTYYLRTANATGSATTTCKYWDGVNFTAVTSASDGTDSSGSMKQSGTYSFDSTASVAKPLHWEGVYLYAYLFQLSAGSAVIYNVTLDAPFQDIVDVWDGVYRQPIQLHVGRGLDVSGGALNGAGTLTVYVNTGGFGFGYQMTYNRVVVPSSDADFQAIRIGAKIIANAETRYVTAKNEWIDGNVLVLDSNVAWSSAAFTYTNPVGGSTADYKDYTLEVNEKSYSDYPIAAEIDALALSTDHILVGFEERMSAIQFDMIADRVNTNTAQMQVSYWTGTSWESGVMSDTTQGLPGTSGVNKSFNRSGLASWQSPPAENEFRQTLFGVTAYYYQITVNATLSGTEGDDKHNILIDLVKGIPAQNVINPFKFSVQYKNRLMLCGFTKGGEGNRIDYSVKDAPDVFNGDESSMDGIQSLYIGGKEDLTAGIEIFNRFGSNIISSLLLFKKNETYLLTGDGPDNYKIYCISKTIGCPAPLTLDTAETGYTYAEEVNRNIAIWTSYVGPMIFDASAIIPVPGINLYFDPAKSTRIQTSIIERCRGTVDNTYKEYDLLIPSVSGATNCNIWIAYDLVRKRWFQKNPGASEVPQAIWPVFDTDGVQYLYGGINDGNVMRLESGATWADDSATAMLPVIETGDFFPSGDVWDKTRLRRLKVAVKKITESNKNLAITHYADTGTSGTSLTVLDLDSGDPVTRSTQGINLLGWAHRFKFELSSGFASETQLHPIAWAAQYFVEMEDV